MSQKIRHSALIRIFFDPIHKSAEVVMIAGDENYARVVYRDERQSVTVGKDGEVEFYLYAQMQKS